MERFAEQDLLLWYTKKRRKPLIIRGARQVGKSTLVHQFAAKQNLIVNEINLERYLYLNNIFKTLDIDILVHEISGIVKRNIKAPDSLLFLDEIQATPFALQALRYFYEELPDLPVIAAGSLLEFTLSDHNFSMPVGRIEYYHLGPMSFNEYLLAIDDYLYNYVKEFVSTSLNSDSPLKPDTLDMDIPDSIHNGLLKRQREYLFTGGMPEAVLEYKETQSLQEVTDIHRSICSTYKDDFAKYAKHRELERLQKVFDNIPGIIGQKVKYSQISREDRSLDIKTALMLLIKARICYPVFHSSCSGIPLHATYDSHTFKLLFLDIGLANFMSGIDWHTISSIDDQRLINEGALAEQFIGQHLLYLNGGKEEPVMHYWLREGKSANAEIDFVFSRGNRIIPVEVKAGKSGSLKSLQQFVIKKNKRFAIRFDLNKPSMQEIKHITRVGQNNQKADFTLLSLPLYLVDNLSAIVDIFRGSHS